MQEPLRIVVIISDPTLVAEGDEHAQALEERSRLLRIGLLEAGYNLVATLPADVFLTERLAQLQADMVIVDAESDARDALEHVVMATRDARRPIVMFTNDSDTAHVNHAVASGVTAYIVAGLAPERIHPILTVAMARFKHEQAPDAAVLDQITECLGLNQTGVIQYQDARRGQRRAAQLSAPQAAGGERHLTAFMLAGDTLSADWLQAVLFNQNAAQSFGRHLLQPRKTPPLPLAAARKQVCSCWNVSEDAILSGLQAMQGEREAKLAQLQDSLKCGTQCGSCLPELRRLVRESTVAHEPAITASV